MFINAGGANVDGYRCDVAGAYYSGLSQPIVLPKNSKINGKCTHQYETSRTSSTNLVYNIPVPYDSTHKYPVYLMFREMEPGLAVGDRVFSITINKKLIDADFDILSNADHGAPFILEAGSIEAVNNIIKITLAPVSGKPVISGIGIQGPKANKLVGNTGLKSCAAPTAEPTAVAVSNSCPGTNDLAINVGSLEKSEGFRCDTGSYASDSKFFSIEPPKSIKKRCMNQFFSMRYSAKKSEPLAFHLPVPPGRYKVQLGFAEIQGKRRGERMFDVIVNKKLVAKEVDVAARVGANAPYTVSFTTRSKMNLIDVHVMPKKGHPMLSSIIVSSLSGSKANALARSTGLDTCAASGTNAFIPREFSRRNHDPKYVAACPEPGDFFINAGGANTDENFRCDIDGFFASPGAIAFPPRKSRQQTEPIFKGVGCIDQYKTHRYVRKGDLTYTIPVAPGKYSVLLMFLENWRRASNGTRLFTITVNNQTILNPHGGRKFDIYYLAGGYNIPYVVKAPQVATEGPITVVIGRVPGRNNPFISGIGVKGEGATEVLGTTGLQSCANPNDDTPKQVKDLCKAKRAAKVDFTNDTAAHAVSGGPYFATDYDKTRNQTVELDGTGSHSHSIEGQRTHVITNWLWSWRDPSNSLADSHGVVKMAGPTPQPKFPLGVTQLTLEVVDTACNRAIDKTTVTVHEAAKQGAYCYFYDLGQSESEMMPIPKNLKDGARPTFARNVGDINFMSVHDFARVNVPFRDNSFAVRCCFAVMKETESPIPYKISSNGIIEVYKNKKLVYSSMKYGEDMATISSGAGKGMQKWEVLYFRKENSPASMKFLDNNEVPLPPSTVRHDAADLIPVLESASKISGLVGNDIVLKGTAFHNGVQVKFGDEIAQTIDVKANEVTVRVPPKAGEQSTVDIIVMTNAGVSNGITFTYGQPKQPCAEIGFVPDTFKKDGKQFEIIGITVCKYGPDGRLYFGSLFNELFSVAHDKNLRISQQCRKRIPDKLQRSILGIAFDPTDKDIRMYFSTSTYEWKGKSTTPPKIKNYGKGWTNGKIQSITAKPGGCFNDDIKDVITGLPVSAHDHATNWVEFLPNGKMLVAVGGFTNGGIAHPSMGGDPENLLSAAVLECPKSGYNIRWTNLNNPTKSRLVPPRKGETPCTIYAAGIRNSFGGLYHSNGEVYATDNGPNPGFGDFSTDCNGGKVRGRSDEDLLFKLEKGRCHGHPNLTRAKLLGKPEQCERGSRKCVQPMNKLPSSTNGIIDYRSNLFNGEMKGNLMFSEFVGGGTGFIGRVILNQEGKTQQYFRKFQADSGLSLAEGPRGELVMARVHKSTFLIMKPVCRPTATVTYLIGVHPKRGSWLGGQRVLISGFNFGERPQAKFGSAYCTDVKIIDNTQFTCVTPKGVPNTQVKVVVEGRTGENVPTEGSDFWYW